ncbi:MAG: ATP synthase F0 subunit C [Elusimicrobiota bacterium]
MELTFLGLGYIGAGVGAGLTLIGAAYGIGKLASSALEGTARQPEAANTIRTTMIIAAALIEGIAFLSLVICLLIAMNFGMPKSENTTAQTNIEQVKK